MKQINRTSAIIFCLLFSLGNAWADEFHDTIDIFQKAGESGKFFNSAHGYAVFPTIGKVGIGVGGSYGSGKVYAGHEHVGDTTATQLTIGFQLGAQAFSQIIFFQDKRAFEEFTIGNFEFGAQANAVAITAGVSGTASTIGHSVGASGGRNDATTAGEYNKGMATFTIAKGGLMYEASVGGQKFSYTPK